MGGIPSAMMEVGCLADTGYSKPSSGGSSGRDNVGGLVLKCGSTGRTGMLDEVSAEVPKDNRSGA